MAKKFLLLFVFIGFIVQSRENGRSKNVSEWSINALVRSSRNNLQWKQAVTPSHFHEFRLRAEQPTIPMHGPFGPPNYSTIRAIEARDVPTTNDHSYYVVIEIKDFDLLWKPAGAGTLLSDTKILTSANLFSENNAAISTYIRLKFDPFGIKSFYVSPTNIERLKNKYVSLAMLSIPPLPMIPEFHDNYGKFGFFFTMLDLDTDNLDINDRYDFGGVCRIIAFDQPLNDNFKNFKFFYVYPYTTSNAKKVVRAKDYKDSQMYFSTSSEQCYGTIGSIVTCNYGEKWLGVGVLLSDVCKPLPSHEDYAIITADKTYYWKSWIRAKAFD